MHFKPIIIISICFALVAATAAAQETAIEQVNDAIARAEALSKEMVLPDSKNPAAEAAAHSVANHFNSAEFQARLSKEKNRINTVLFKGYTDGIKGQADSEQSLFGKLPNDERIYILFSESVPAETIRAYVHDLDALNDGNIVMVLRGFVDGMQKVQPTLEYIQGLLVKQKGCRVTVANQCEMYRANIDIDPLIYRKFGVTEVPAFVYARGVQLSDAEQSLGNESNQQSVSDYFILYGDVSLNYALEKFADMSGSDHLAKIARELNSGYYGGES